MTARDERLQIFCALLTGAWANPQIREAPIMPVDFAVMADEAHKTFADHEYAIANDDNRSRR